MSTEGDQPGHNPFAEYMKRINGPTGGRQQDRARRISRRILELEDDLEVVGEAKTVEAVSLWSKNFGPHWFIMDVTMPLLNGLQATSQISQSRPSHKSPRFLVHR